MHDLLQIGTFPALAQELIDSEFRCHSRQDLETDARLRTRVRGIITRSNFAVPGEAIASVPNLGIIAVCGVGYDLVALGVAAQRGAIVTHTPAILDSAVAELCIGMLLCLLRRLPEADRFVRTGSWPRGAFALASNLAGKRVGIVGLGRIGKEIAHRLEAFGVSLSYFGRSDQNLPWRFEPDLHALARNCDVLMPHIGSATDETRLAMARLTLDNLHRFFESGTTLTPIDAVAGA